MGYSINPSAMLGAIRDWCLENFSSGGGNNKTVVSVKPKLKYRDSSVEIISWTGGLPTNVDGRDFWSDGKNTYYSSGTAQYVLNKETGEWSAKTWTGLSNFRGYDIWSDGINIYYSNSSTQKKLNVSSDSWEDVTWTGLRSFNGIDIWTDGKEIYYSSSSSQYILSNRWTNTWSEKTWNGLTQFYGQYVWSDGDSIYYSNGDSYVLDRVTETWSEKTWNGYSRLSASYIWIDNYGDCHYSNTNDSNSYILDKKTESWIPESYEFEYQGTVYRDLSVFFNGKDVWTDGENLYFSGNGKITIEYVNVDL